MGWTVSQTRSSIFTWTIFVCLYSLCGQATASTCTPDKDRVNCGYIGIGEKECKEKRHCCWDSSWFTLTRCYLKNDDFKYFDPDGIRFGCGYFRITKEKCIAKGCHWSPKFPSPSCNYPNTDVDPKTCSKEQVACGRDGITKDACESNGCCWHPTGFGKSSTPTCISAIVPVPSPEPAPPKPEPKSPEPEPKAPEPKAPPKPEPTSPEPEPKAPEPTTPKPEPKAPPKPEPTSPEPEPKAPEPTTPKPEPKAPETMTPKPGETEFHAAGKPSVPEAEIGPTAQPEDVRMEKILSLEFIGEEVLRGMNTAEEIADYAVGNYFFDSNIKSHRSKYRRATFK